MAALKPKERTTDVAPHNAICQLNFGPDEFSRLSGLTFQRLCDGLGELDEAVGELGGIEYIFESRPSTSAERRNVFVYVLSYVTHLELARRHLLEALGLGSSDLAWAPEYGPVEEWSLLRFDDNGNEVEMMRFPDEDRAEFARRTYELRGHKQLYSVRRST